MSTLGERSNTLALMDHTTLLDMTIAALRDAPNPYLPVREQGRDYLYVRIDQIAQTLARTQAPSLPHPVQSTGKDPSCVTIHATPQQERAFSRNIKTLDRLLADQLTKAVEAKEFMCGVKPCPAPGRAGGQRWQSDRMMPRSARDGRAP